MKRILLTGGSGFIGHNIFETLSKKYEIFAPTHKQLDITDYEKVENYIYNHKIKTVIHSAIKGGDGVFKTTLQMFISITRNLKYLDKIIHFGSGAEYAKTRDIKEIKETQLGKVIPEDDYGLAKYICSQMAMSQEEIITLRPFGVYGKYEQPYFKFISNSIVKNIFKLPIEIKQDVVFDYLYIDDLVKIVDYFIKTPLKKLKFKDFNITPHKPIKLSQIAELINEFSNNPSKINIVNPGLNFEYTGDNQRLKKQIKSFNFTSYEESIKKLFTYYRNQLNKLDKQEIIKDRFFDKSQIKS